MDNLSFWGIFLVLIGLALLTRVLLNVDFPVFRVLAGLFLVLLGLKIIFGGSVIWPVKSGANEFIFSNGVVDASDDPAGYYHLAFSRVDFNLDSLEITETPTIIRINSVFSGCTVFLPADTPLSIDVDAVFGGVKMPMRNSPFFGRGTYISDGFDPDTPHLVVSVNVVFGNVTLMYR